MSEKRVTVFVLSGFLGSGKTTFLTKAIDHFTEAGLQPAVIMNEIGDVNLDGLLVDIEVPMAELLSGCICCSIRGDLATTLQELVTEKKPDVIFIESTGVANPMEILEEVTDASLILPMELAAVITVVDAPQLLELSRTSRGKTFRLMRDQIRCANLLLLNKTDLLPAAELQEVEALVREWNPYARLHFTVFSQIDMRLLEEMNGPGPVEGGAEPPHADAHRHRDNERDQDQTAQDQDHHDGHADPAHGQDHHDGHRHDHGHAGHHHHSHDHVMAYTHYFEHAIDSNDFEAFISKLPQEVYRAKGILSFSDTASRFMFQYAYREMDFVKITPQGQVPDVAVFIGENFSKDAVRTALRELEASAAEAAKS